MPNKVCQSYFEEPLLLPSYNSSLLSLLLIFGSMHKALASTLVLTSALSCPEGWSGIPHYPNVPSSSFLPSSLESELLEEVGLHHDLEEWVEVTIQSSQRLSLYSFVQFSSPCHASYALHWVTVGQTDMDIKLLVRPYGASSSNPLQLADEKIKTQR